MDFDLVDLRLFDEVLRTGSITGGAAAANMSLAAASARLRQLELRAGVALLERHRRGARPTAAGAALHEHARRMLAEAQALAAALREHNRLLRGDLRLAVNTAALFHGLPERLAAFLLRHPSFDLAIAEHPSDEAAAAVRAGRADLAIVAGHADRTGLRERPWRPDRLVLALPAGHRLAGAARLSLAEVAGEPFVGLGAESALQRHVEARAAPAGRLRIRARLGNAGQLMRLVAAGAGLAVLPRAVTDEAPPGLVAIPLDEPWARRTLHLVWSRESPPLIRLVEHIGGP